MRIDKSAELDVEMFGDGSFRSSRVSFTGNGDCKAILGVNLLEVTTKSRKPAFVEGIMTVGKLDYVIFTEEAVVGESTPIQLVAFGANMYFRVRLPPESTGVPDLAVFANECVNIVVSR